MIYDDGDVRVLDFGTGDIGVGTASMEYARFEDMIVFFPTPEGTIGRSHSNKGKTDEEVGTRVKFIFKKVESIDVLLRQLQKIKNDMIANGVT